MSTSAQEGMPTERPAPLRFITATSLFDGHDAAIHLIRRLLLAQGAEVIHLGHSRSVEEIVRAACQEDADGVAISSYQGGHLEFFRYLVECLRAQGAGHIRVFGGGGATITAAEAEALEQDGVERVYRAEDGVRLGLEAMVGEVLERTRRSPPGPDPEPPAGPDDHTAIGRALSLIERGAAKHKNRRSRTGGARRAPARSWASRARGARARARSSTSCSRGSWRHFRP